MPLTIGSRLGHYEVTALIGEGGMGQVYHSRVVVNLTVPKRAREVAAFFNQQEDCRAVARRRPLHEICTHDTDGSEDTRTRTTLRRRGDVHAPEEGHSAGADGKFIFFRRAWKRGSEGDQIWRRDRHRRDTRSRTATANPNVINAPTSTTTPHAKIPTVPPNRSQVHSALPSF